MTHNRNDKNKTRSNREVALYGRQLIAVSYHSIQGSKFQTNLLRYSDANFWKTNVFKYV